MCISFGVQAACLLPVIGEIVHAYVVKSQCEQQDKIESRYRHFPDMMKKEFAAHLKEINKLHYIGIIRNILTIAAVVAGIATGIFPVLLLIPLFKVGQLLISKVDVINKNNGELEHFNTLCFNSHYTYF